MLGLAAIIIGSFVAMVGLITSSIRMDNKLLKQREEWRKAEKWNWD